MPTKKSPHTTHRQHHPRCNFQFADGRRCRMLRHPHLELCLFHNRELVQLQSAQEIGAELLALSGNFRSPIALNFVLGKLFGHVATGRMHRRQASTLAYIAQLLLQTLDTKRYDLARDWHDFAALIPTLDAIYGPDGSRSPASGSHVAPPFSSPRGTKGAASAPVDSCATVSGEGDPAPPSESQDNDATEFPTNPHDFTGEFPPATTNAQQPPEPHARL